MKVSVVGAGPSGLAIARLLSDKGFNVRVFEAQSDYAVKPCGWGLPYTEDLNKTIFYKDIYDSIIWEFKGYRVYIDGEKLFESSSRRVLGYIVDKRDLLRRMAEGVEVHLKTPVRFIEDRRIIIRGSEEIRSDLVINAGGFYTQKKNLDRILAIQYYLEGSIEDPEIPELYFNSELVGYAWIFPEGARRARIGVGGYASRDFLEKILSKVIMSREDLKKAEIVKREGALVTVSGIDWSLAEDKNIYYVGESIGAVMPATGEGIRPSIFTSIALYNSIIKGTSYREELSRIKLFKAMEIQRKILDLEVMVSPQARKRFLMKTPEDILIKISLGDLSERDLMKIAMRPENLKILINILKSSF